MSAATRRIAVLQGHPDPGGGHFGHALADAYVAGARGAGHDVQVIPIAKLVFPFLHNREELDRGTPPPHIRDAQAAIEAADHLVLIYPVWNGAIPALVKAFFEQAFRPAFIFPGLTPGEKVGFWAALRRKKAMTGKSARIVATMEMPSLVYRLLFHPRSERTSLRLAGFKPIAQSLIGLIEAPNGARHRRWVERMRALGVAGR